MLQQFSRWRQYPVLPCPSQFCRQPKPGPPSTAALLRSAPLARLRPFCVPPLIFGDFSLPMVTARPTLKSVKGKPHANKLERPERAIRNRTEIPIRIPGGIQDKISSSIPTYWTRSFYRRGHRPGDCVLEIGPGISTMTQYLAEPPAR